MISKIEILADSYGNISQIFVDHILYIAINDNILVQENKKLREEVDVLKKLIANHLENT